MSVLLDSDLDSDDRLEFEIVKLDLPSLLTEFRKVLHSGDFSSAYSICECMLSLIALEMRSSFY